jgi:branched-chain amino acid transport system substrate-binding protein
MRKTPILILILIVFLFSCTENEGRKRKKEREIPTYRIGVNLPLTGNGSYFAEEFKKGMDLAFEHLGDSSGKIRIEAIYEDNKLNPKDAVTITKKFIEIDDVDLVVTGYTPIIQATVGLLDREGIPSLLTISSAANVAAKHEWAFRDFELESEIMPLLASYAYDGLDLRRGSWLVINDDMGKDAVDFFSERFTELGGEMPGGEVFEPSELDLRNKINKVMDNDPDFIIVVGRGSAMINAIRQIRERAPELPIICNNTVDNEMVWTALGEDGDFIWYPRPYIDFSARLYNKANDRFKAKHGEDMNWLNIYGMSIVTYLVKGLRNSEGERESMREYLRTLDVPSIRGRLVMDENSDVNVPHVVYTRINGQSMQAEEYTAIEKND